MCCLYWRRYGKCRLDAGGFREFVLFVLEAIWEMRIAHRGIRRICAVCAGGDIKVAGAHPLLMRHHGLPCMVCHHGVPCAHHSLSTTLSSCPGSILGCIPPSVIPNHALNRESFTSGHHSSLDEPKKSNQNHWLPRACQQPLKGLHCLHWHDPWHDPFTGYSPRGVR